MQACECKQVEYRRRQTATRDRRRCCGARTARCSNSMIERRTSVVGESACGGRQRISKMMQPAIFLAKVLDVALTGAWVRRGEFEKKELNPAYGVCRRRGRARRTAGWRYRKRIAEGRRSRMRWSRAGQDRRGRESGKEAEAVGRRAKGCAVFPVVHCTQLISSQTLCRQFYTRSHWAGIRAHEPGRQLPSE